MPVVGFFITSSNISHALLSFALPLLHVYWNLHRSPGGLHKCPKNLTSVWLTRFQAK